MLHILLLVASVDSAKLRPVEVDYIAPIERYFDSTMNGYDDTYDRLREQRHRNEKCPDAAKSLMPTYYYSPFSRRDWC